MREWDYEHVGGKSEGRIGVRGTERSFRSGDVGIFCDGGDEVSC